MVSSTFEWLLTLSVGETRAEVQAEIDELKPVLVTGSPMRSAKGWKEKRAETLAQSEFVVESYCEEAKRGCGLLQELLSMSCVELRRGDQRRLWVSEAIIFTLGNMWRSVVGHSDIRHNW